MAETIVFPDAVAFAINVLRARLDDAHMDAVSVTPGPHPPAPAIVVRRIGGGRKNLVVDEPVLRVETFGTDDAQACDLGEQSRAWLRALARTTEFNVTVYVVDDVNTAGDPDPISDTPRYVFDLKLSLRGHAT